MNRQRSYGTTLGRIKREINKAQDSENCGDYISAYFNAEQQLEVINQLRQGGHLNNPRLSSEADSLSLRCRRIMGFCTGDIRMDM